MLPQACVLLWGTVITKSQKGCTVPKYPQNSGATWKRSLFRVEWYRNPSLSRQNQMQHQSFFIWPCLFFSTLLKSSISQNTWEWSDTTRDLTWFLKHDFEIINDCRTATELVLQFSMVTLVTRRPYGCRPDITSFNRLQHADSESHARSYNHC